MHIISDLWALANEYPLVALSVTTFLLFMAAVIVATFGIAVFRVSRVVRETADERITIEFRDG